MESWPLCIGFIIGLIAFGAKVVAFSSWILWPWYGFPAFIGLIALAHAADDLLLFVKVRPSRLVEIGASCAMVLALMTHQVIAGGIPYYSGFEWVNKKAVAQLAPALNDARVAMGDRAGSFAYFYGGGVTQLEGLVGDKRYYEALRARQDVRPLLCARGVRYVLAYERDLGDYTQANVEVLRSHLTQYRVPTLQFQKSDEVGRVFDLEKFDGAIGDVGDVYLYACRLSGCGVAH